MVDRVGQQLGNYQLIQLLGQGSLAEVYLGGHIHLGMLAAIKVLHAPLSSEEIAPFRREARVIAHLVHPNIVRVLEFGIENHTPFLVMDFAPHGSLRQHYPRGTLLPLALVVSYSRQVADALQFAHDERVVHRDVKPENLLLGRRKEVLLSDFGIAILTQRPQDQSPYHTAGTLRYMAPEQLQGQPCLASDQYALAIVVYEWLCGRCPFQGSSALEVAMQHLSHPPQPLRELVVLATWYVRSQKKQFILSLHRHILEKSMSTFVGDTIYTHVFSFLYLKGLSRATYKVIELVKSRTVWPNMCEKSCQKCVTITIVAYCHTYLVYFH